MASRGYSFQHILPELIAPGYAVFHASSAYDQAMMHAIACLVFGPPDKPAARRGDDRWFVPTITSLLPTSLACPVVFHQ